MKPLRPIARLAQRSLRAMLWAAAVLLALWLGFLGGRALGWTTRLNTNGVRSVDRTTNDRRLPVISSATSSERALRRRLAGLIEATQRPDTRFLGEAKLKLALVEMSEEELLAALDILRSWPESVRRQALESLMERWAQLNPQAAFAWATEHLMTPKYLGAWYRLFWEWGRVDPVAALEKTYGIGQPDLRSSAMFTLHQQLARRDPMTALERALSLKKHDRDSAIDGWSESAARSEMAAGLMRSLAEAPDAPNVMNRFFVKWAQADRAAAFAWLESSGPSEEARHQIEGSWFALQSRRNARLAADEWLATAAPEQQPQRLDAIVKQWLASTGNDFNDCAAWLTPHLGNPQADQALSSFSQRAVEIDPVSALTWAGRITEATARQQALDALHDRMREIAPAEVGAWLEEAPLSDAERERLRRR